MFFTDLFYWTFVLAAIVIYYIVPRPLRAFVLFGSGIFFYTYYAGYFITLLLLEVILVYAAAREFAKDKPNRKSLFVATLLIVISILAFFKYRGMMWDSLTSIFQVFGTTTLPRVDDFILPLAISYFTFELIHYVVEQRKGTLPDHRFQGFLSFILFFPTLVAGPIKQFQQFIPQLSNVFSWQNVFMGITRILIGLFKKLVLANSLNILVTPLYSHEGITTADATVLWIGLIAYTFVIYFDFSGYSDIAIGTARLFGIVLPENFRWPYLSRNIAEFWGRWHISLGSWLTRYIYFPLGGSRVSATRTYFNLMVTLGVSGLWHGASWHFVVWGLFHGAMLVVHRFYFKNVKPLLRIPNPLKLVTIPSAIALTFFGVTISRVFFIMPLNESLYILRGLFGL